MKSAPNHESNPTPLQPGIYAILQAPELQCQNPDWYIEQTRKLAPLPLAALQFRAKELTDDQCLGIVEEILGILRDHDCRFPFIINDRIHLAKRFHLGLHLGQEDLSIHSDEFKKSGNGLLGISTHDAQQAQRAIQQRADYIGFGPVFPTATKADALPPRSEKTLREVLQQSPIPVVAIGGVKPLHISALVHRGVRHIAMISALWENPQAVVQYVEKCLGEVDS